MSFYCTHSVQWEATTAKAYNTQTLKIHAAQKTLGPANTRSYLSDKPAHNTENVNKEKPGMSHKVINWHFHIFALFELL